MSDFSVVIYEDSHLVVWNDFIRKAGNATFLFDRNFMEYHSDRFDDFSLMIFQKEQLVAVFPAHRIENKIFSHSGLTYGGLCLLKKTDIVLHKSCLQVLLSFLRAQDLTHLTVKVLPQFYDMELVNQFRYLAFVCGGILKGSELNMCIDYNNYAISKSKLKHLRKPISYDLEIVEAAPLSVFWKSVLEPLLMDRYRTTPVHSLEEMEQLQKNFPENIKQFAVYCDAEIVGGITIFEFEDGVKSQYGAATVLGKELRALDYLFVHLISKYQKCGMRFFDMGVVTDSSEMGFNAGLLQQKKELGCTTFLQDIIEFEL